MIISINDIRAIRPIANNIDEGRVNTYIREAELLDVMPSLGGTLYQRFDEGADLTAEESLLLNGGYYNEDCGGTWKIEGIKVAIAYFAYARFLRNNQINSTAYGVVVKMGEESSTAEYRAVAAQAAESQNIGEAILTEAMRYWDKVSGNCCDNKRSAKRKFVAIGR